MSHSKKIQTQTKSFDDACWNEHYPKLQQYCRFLAQNAWDGDDIAQETFLKAQRYKGEEHKLSSALLNKIAYHHWIDLLRKRKREVIAAEEGLDQQDGKRAFDMKGHSVELLLSQFTPKQAVIFFLKEGFRYQLKEIALILQTSETAVKSNLHRAKQRLEKDGEPFSTDSFWDEKERNELSELFYKTLEAQDPALLIHALPSLKSVIQKPTYTPKCTLCMAA
ncbi:sigma-70 family RNA polymerase sigma factor [Priestia megaterium]|uniref:sigma-70 family RNA polymerase sigma factor n=1 Tax=Priestia megaterium TaxID=1404 RepID=UPI003012F8B8